MVLGRLVVAREGFTGGEASSFFLSHFLSGIINKAEALAHGQESGLLGLHMGIAGRRMNPLLEHSFLSADWLNDVERIPGP